MKNRIDLCNFDIRTDLIIDNMQKLQEKNMMEVEEYCDQDICVSKVLLNENNKKYFNKEVGKYITIEFSDITNFEDRERLGKIFENELKELIKILTKIKKALKDCPTSKKQVKVGWDNKGPIYEEITVYCCDLANELLPPTSGFFFGSQDIDEWYIKDLNYSIKIFKQALKLSQEHNYEIIYEASW